MAENEQDLNSIEQLEEKYMLIHDTIVKFCVDETRYTTWYPWKVIEPLTLYNAAAKNIKYKLVIISSHALEKLTLNCDKHDEKRLTILIQFCKAKMEAVDVRLNELIQDYSINSVRLAIVLGVVSIVVSLAGLILTIFTIS